MKKFITSVLVCLLVFLQACPVYAQTATSSNWDADARKASASDWNFFTPFDWDSYEAEFGISSRAGVQAVTNTVNYSGVTAYLTYYDMSNNIRYFAQPLSSSGSFTIIRPDNYAKPVSVFFRLNPSAFPSSGIYDFSLRFASHTGQEYTSGYFFSSKLNTNASDQSSSTRLNTGADFYQSSGEFYLHQVLDFNASVQFLDVGANFSQSRLGIFPVGGDVYINFTKSTATPDYTTAGGPQTSQDIQQDISNSTGQIADNTEAINGTLKELIQHISNQLAALWDQMYNYMHVPLVSNDNARTQRIIDRLDEGFDINVETIDRNFHDLMANDDKNTNTVVNGYDNSGMNSDKNRLDTAMGNYTDVENSVLDSVNSALGNFEFSGSMDSYLVCIGTVSGFMQNLYDSSGALKDAIVIGFLLSIASIVIGLYRFKEG